MEKEKKNMSKNMSKNVSKNVTVCPVCGRFAKKAAVDKHNASLAELRTQLQNETTKRKEAESDLIIVKNNLERAVREYTRLQAKIGEHYAEVSKIHKTIEDQSKYINDLARRIEMWESKAHQQEEMIEKLKSATWWQRLFKIQP